MTGPAYLLAAMAVAASTATIDRAVVTATHEIEAAAPSIACRTQNEPQGYACIQQGANGPDHFAAVTIGVRPAQRILGAGRIVVESALMGPGGASTRYVGQTRDHRYDVVATQADSLGAHDRSALPAAPDLIRRVVTLYAQKNSHRGE